MLAHLIARNKAKEEANNNNQLHEEPKETPARPGYESLSLEECRKFDQYALVRFIVADLHGIGRCSLVTKYGVQKYIKRGVELYAG